MRYIDMDSWPRRKHFEIYNAFDYPHVNLCADVDITAFFPAVKDASLSLTSAVTYVIAKVANSIPEFRYRIRDGKVIEHEVVHPSITILTNDELFSFCTIPFVENFAEFITQATETIAYFKEHPTLEDEPGQDDLLFTTNLPWVSFISMMHPIHMSPADSVPRIAWGKVRDESGVLKMPLSVQGHHGLMDGLHIGRYF
ncbi:MAG: chloramphenicol acetyltransferase [Anaerolineales bacterium]|nr:chloramphenicol acetyltransferase [Anaerolineales bacterium]